MSEGAEPKRWIHAVVFGRQYSPDDEFLAHELLTEYAKAWGLKPLGRMAGRPVGDMAVPTILDGAVIVEWWDYKRFCGYGMEFALLNPDFAIPVKAGECRLRQVPTAANWLMRGREEIWPREESFDGC